MLKRPPLGFDDFNPVKKFKTTHGSLESLDKMPGLDETSFLQISNPQYTFDVMKPRLEDSSSLMSLDIGTLSSEIVGPSLNDFDMLSQRLTKLEIDVDTKLKVINEDLDCKLDQINSKLGFILEKIISCHEEMIRMELEMKQSNPIQEAITKKQVWQSYIG